MTDGHRRRPSVADCLLVGHHWLAHRGGFIGQRLVDENSLAAFQQAYDHGINHLETDLRLSRDHVLFCCHDARLSRLAGINQPIRAMTAAQLAQLPLEHGQGLSRFKEVIEALPQAFFNVDLKAKGTPVALAQLIDQRPELADRLLVTSFSSRRLAQFRRLVHYPVALGLPTLWVLWLLLSPLAGLGPRPPGQAIQLPASIRLSGRSINLLSPHLRRMAQRWGLSIDVWLGEPQQSPQALFDQGANGVFVDQLAGLPKPPMDPAGDSAISYSPQHCKEAHA
ncbi:MAG: hypothetical protein LBV30_10125 [Propionibacteriaceae bacterium]|nr:hypothetical protein [Propionibacteriaceae bacterium]